MWGFSCFVCMYVCICPVYVGVLGGQRYQDPLELELHMGVKC